MQDDDNLSAQVIAKIGAPYPNKNKNQRIVDEAPQSFRCQHRKSEHRQIIGTLLETAEKEAAQLGDEYTSVEHLLIAAAVDKSSSVGELLRAQNVTKETILRALKDIRGTQRVTTQNPEDKYQSLARYGKDLMDLSRKGKLDPVIGREEEVRRVLQVLSRRTKNNPVLVGDPGVGKTAIAEGIAQRIAAGDVPEKLEKINVSLHWI